MEEQELLAMQQELAALRQEKQSAALRAHAEALLKGEAISTAFAPFLAKEDESGTEEAVRTFSALWRESLSAAVKSRLPDETPKAAAPTRTLQTRRGVIILR